MRKSALYLWCAGLAIVTFDLVLTMTVGGFTIKSYYFLFLAAAGLFYWTEPQPWRSLRAMLTPPWAFAFLLFAYDLGMSPFSFVPKKSLAYSGWILFDLLVVAIPGMYLVREAPGKKPVFVALLAATFFLVGILLIDLAAFQYGYTAGFIGYNQEPSLMWGMSRAHAFSYEPSYLSLYFTFSLFLFLGEILSPAPVLPRWLLSSGSAALLVGIFLLTSRTGWALTALGLIAILGRYYRFFLKREGRIFGGLLLAAAISVAIFLPAHHLERMQKNLVTTLATGTDGSGNTRLKAMLDGINIGMETRGLGTGLGASFFYYINRHPEVVTPYLNISMKAEYIMSTWGQIFAESGFPGLIAYLLFGIGMILTLFRQAKENGEARNHAALVSASLFFLIAAHLVGNVARTDVWVWFAIWGAYFHEPRKA